MIEAFLVLLTIGCTSMSIRLTLTTRRLTKAEATLQQVVSVVAMADPETFKKLDVNAALPPLPAPPDPVRLAEIALEREKLAAKVEIEKAKIQADTAVKTSFWGNNG